MEETKSEGARLSKGKRIALVVLILLTLLVLGYGGWMIKHHMDYAITNAVFVDTENIINVGFQRVGGRVVELTKREGDPVKKEEVIARIYDRDYRLAVEALEKEVEAAKEKKQELEVTLNRITPQLHFNVDKARDRVGALKEEIGSVKAEIGAVDAQIAQLRRDRKRYWNLYLKRAVAKHDFEAIDTRLKVALKKREALDKKLKALLLNLRAAKRDLKIAEEELKRIDETKRAIAELDKRIASLQAKLKDAKLQLSYCVLKSPITGRVAKKYVSVGDVVGPGIPVYALVDPKDIFILVLLEETKLEGVEPGCPAKIKIDAYPDEEYRGVVEKILPTSAAKFALVPRDISAGEFTKVVQRIPVKVKITEGDISKLVVGMGGEIEIKRRK
ncbi:multidrug resistance protein A [Thermosulfidibacter takaii ABI70S6]|uniref:Multidrug resistance protein A n=1 Tax=Thermosulfidibacter takaii (strain DSM 17441 / JCM 13301 / NBRC 103674 / ABI70S6) TaxID=1298851 RepID=A0A0S3QU93_THET7|nr:HlyD family efflux transporter periplasmic adaptor subunit [Thermosulfidibacter takaii]BAT71879.1 multidrug resistance protein A [Thermosulfidibacter takaii ABI70S6]